MTPFQRKIETRDRMIVAAIKAGTPIRALAETYGLCRSRITQIGYAAGIRKGSLRSAETCEKISRARQKQAREKRKGEPPTRELVRHLRAENSQMRFVIKKFRAERAPPSPIPQEDRSPQRGRYRRCRALCVGRGDGQGTGDGSGCGLDGGYDGSGCGCSSDGSESGLEGGLGDGSKGGLGGRSRRPAR